MDKKSGKDVVIRASYLWDGLMRKPIPDGILHMHGKKIIHAGRIDENYNFSQDQILEFPGCTLMPGMIDCHTHLSMDGELENYLDHMRDPVPVLTLRAAAMMQRDLAAGITTCRCCGDREYLDIACRRAVEEELIPGPNLLVAAKGIRAPKGHGFVGYPFDGAEAIRNAVAANVRAGADFIKIYISGTLKGQGELPAFLTSEEIKTAINTAHDSGLAVTAHCVGGEGLDMALDLGLDCLEHVYHINDNQINNVSRADVFVVLTPGPMLSDDRIQRLPENLIEGHLKEKEIIRERMRAFIGSGKKFAVGTDGLHGGLYREVAYLVEMGATHFEALQAATLHGAITGGIGDRCGSLEPGKDADIVIVEGNPFEDISALERVRAVWKGGSIKKHERIEMN